MSREVEETARLAACPHCGETHGEDALRCPATDMLLPLEGRRLDGKFRFVTALGSGGMASVWLAVNERVDREVAIKFLRPEIGRDAEAVARFRSEAKAAGRIGNPHICEILDLGDSPIGPYMVMERLRGLDLAGLIRRQGRLTPGYAVRVIRHALEGLVAAHEAGIVHRDLKPGNLFLHKTANGETVVKLMDFGVSKFLDGTGEAQTASGILLGTPEYMAPEQLEGAHLIGPAADIFAMGAILYRAITGHQVFSGPNLAAVIKSMAVDEVTPMSRLVEGVPPELEAVIHRCLERDPDDRYPSAQALSEALTPFETLEVEVLPVEEPELTRQIPITSSTPPAKTDGEGDDAKASAAEAGESATQLWRNKGEVVEPVAKVSVGKVSVDEVSVDEIGGAKVSVDEVSVDEIGGGKARAGKTAAGAPNRTRQRWINLALVAALMVVVVVLATKLWNRPAPPESGAGPLAVTPTGDDGQAGASETAATAEPDTGDTDTADIDTADTTESDDTGRPEAEAGQPEAETGEAEAETGEAETGGGQDGAEPFVPASDRPPPPGTIRGGPYITPVNPPGTSDFAGAKKACEALASKRFADVGGWSLANPSETSKFVGSRELKRGRYWSSAVWKGKAKVYTLPSGKSSSEKIDRSIARPLCVAKW